MGKLYIVRHGQTDWNLKHIILSTTNKILNETGLFQAQNTAQMLKNEYFDLIICSPLERAKQTANIINKDRNISIVYDDRIAERDFGEFEGLKDSDPKFKIREFWNYNENIHYDKAESVQNFFNRVYGFLDDISKKYNDKNILLVSHAAVSAVVNCYFTAIPKDIEKFFGMALDNCEYRKYNI